MHLAGTLSLALKRRRRNNNYKNWGIRWLILSNIDLLKWENDRVISISQQFKAKCESHRVFLTVFKDF